MKRDRIYLSHILEAVEKIERYLGDTDYETFVANDMMIDAIIRGLQIIGEAGFDTSVNCIKPERRLTGRAFALYRRAGLR
jgi:uncharacterized protein with HEPN domain